MKKKKFKLPIGLRTVKTAVAVLLSMIVVNFFGTTSSKLFFAVLGALAAVQPTFSESLESCIIQIIGVFVGAVVGGALVMLHVPAMLAASIGIVVVIILCNSFRLSSSAGLACIIVVCMCLDGETKPITYAVTRIWDTAIGLAIGMAVNTLVFPYDNSRRIRGLVESLNLDVIRFLEEVFDGDEVMPDAQILGSKVQDLERQLQIFRNQKLVMKLRRQKKDLENYRICEEKSRELLARLQILSVVGKPGRLNEENRQRLKHAGADIRDKRVLKNPQERDIITNYHVRQILHLREEILEILEKAQTEKKR